MKLNAILQARALAFVELYELDPRGRVFFPEVISKIRDRYGFLSVPKPEDLDEQKGVELKTGRIGNKTIDTLKIFEQLLVLETHSNTSDSQAILQEMLEWGKSQLGLTFEPNMIRHWAYVSIVTFQSDHNILSYSPAAKLAGKVSDAVSGLWKETVKFEPRAMSITHDPLLRKNGVAGFLISPRVETPYSENKFYSEAPLPTDVHIKFLEEFEADALGQQKMYGLGQ